MCERSSPSVRSRWPGDDLARDSQKNQPSGAKWLFCGDAVRIGVANDASGSIDFLRALRAPSAAPFVERNVLHMHAPAAAATAVCCSRAGPFTRGKLPETAHKSATRTEAATDSHADGQTKGAARTVRTYHADSEISIRHTWLGGQDGRIELRFLKFRLILECSLESINLG